MSNRGRHKKFKKVIVKLNGEKIHEFLIKQRLFDYRTIKDIIQTYVK